MKRQPGVHGQDARATTATQSDQNRGTGFQPVNDQSEHARASSRGTGFQPVNDQTEHPGDSMGGTGFQPVNEALEQQPEPLLKIRQGAYLPHWRKSNATYAVTFRLADSLPQSVLLNYKIEREQLLRAMRLTTTKPTRHETEALQKLFSEKIDNYLDAGTGACWTKNPAVAHTVADALKHFDQKRYHLHAWCIMPNHVHVVFDTMSGFSVESILHSWKSFTANKANKLLERHGEFWQTEYYDHIIRDEDDFANQVRYVIDNPASAGLKAWPWVGHAKSAD